MKLINDKIVDDLFESLGLKFLAQQKQDEIMTRILELISQRAGAKIVEGFSEKETKEFNEIPKDDLEQMEDFMILKNPNAEEIFKQEAQVVESELLNNKA
ncbi:MAG: hypothetical protein KAI71_04670 [Candidatus Pacebacteria bacterium]|nr:hypothetical protein [Candidatus Paceibacterota bacterium]